MICKMIITFHAWEGNKDQTGRIVKKIVKSKLTEGFSFSWFLSGISCQILEFLKTL